MESKKSLSQFDEKMLDLIIGSIFDYSEEYPFYHGFDRDSLLEGIESVYKLLRDEPDEVVDEQIISVLDGIWCNIILLERLLSEKVDEIRLVDGNEFIKKLEDNIREMEG